MASESLQFQRPSLYHLLRHFEWLGVDRFRTAIANDVMNSPVVIPQPLLGHLIYAIRAGATARWTRSRPVGFQRERISLLVWVASVIPRLGDGGTSIQHLA